MILSDKLQQVWIAVYSASFERKCSEGSEYMDAAMMANTEANKAVSYLMLLGGIPLTLNTPKD